jgi:hypothetical protein
MGIATIIIERNYRVIPDNYMEPLSEDEMKRVNNYRQGQSDNRVNKPCASANGDYINGWYDSFEKVPPFLTLEQVKYFNV